MDELRGPTIQVVLNIKEGLGFGFLKNPFIVSGSLNGYMLETDPVVPTHAPVFDAELVWEADKRRFRSLRVQNVPVKIEAYTTGTQGRKDKIGYLLLSLLGAQPCPSNKIVDIKQSWHKLLGVKSEGKCCHPQILLSLSIEDRVSTPTPRNELRIFHSNEVALPSTRSNKTVPSSTNSRQMLLTLNDYISESKKIVSSPDLQPKLICDEGLIQIGDGNHLFVLALVIGAVENLDLLLPPDGNEEANCCVTYTVFTHTIMTDRVNITAGSTHMNQRTSLRLRTSLRELARYFAECPRLVATLRVGDSDAGVCSLDLCKLIPTDDINHFVNNFCNNDKALTIHERCYMLPFHNRATDNRRCYMDVELSLKYIGIKSNVQRPVILTARSATQLESDRKDEVIDNERLDFKSGSCTNLDRDIGGVAYTSIAPGNTNRYINASGDALLQTNELAQLIRRMFDSFTLSQEKLLAKQRTSDAQIQCEHVNKENVDDACEPVVERGPDRLESSKSDTGILNNKDDEKKSISAAERNVIMQKYVEELEDWKERQQELFKLQLKRKEEYHLDLLADEWFKRRNELESKLNKGIEQCRTLAADLSRATDDFRLRGYRNTEREKKLLEAKKALETHYTAKYQELREASQKMEDDMNHRLKMKDMTIEELQQKILLLEKQNDVLKNNMKNFEKDAENKYSGLTKDQTASLIQELRSLEEKLDSATQSKAFFKEQWARAVRELHRARRAARAGALARLRRQRTQLENFDPIEDEEESNNENHVDINKLKDDFYVDILTKTPPVLDTHSIISPEEMDLYNDLVNMKNPSNDKLTELISQRDNLIQQESPDEDTIKQLNQEIRNMLINCGS
ncbi:unnamed protein product, partial [Brenthis ino]